MRKMKIETKLCKNCGEPLNEPRSVLPRVGLFEIGKSIYFRILDGHFKSMELCNFCYSVMRSYRHTLSKEERKLYEKK